MNELKIHMEPDELILWQGVPDRRAYTQSVLGTQSIPNSILSAFVGVGTYLVLPPLLTIINLALSIVVAICIFLIFQTIYRKRLEKVEFLGEYAITDKRICARSMRGRLKAIPLKRQVMYKVSRSPTQGSITFSSSGCQSFAFGNILPKQIDEIEKVLATLSDVKKRKV